MKIPSATRCVPFALSLFLASAADAALFVRLADGDLADQAAVIAEVRVLSVDPAAGVERARTEVEVEVEDLISGQAPGSRLVIALAGGVLPDGSRVKLFGTPSFEAGQRALVFLRPRDDGSYAILHLLQGAFHVVDVAGRDVAFRAFAGAREVASGDLPARHPEMPRDLARFRDWLADRGAGVKRAADYFVDLAAEDVPAAGRAGDKFNLLRSSRGVPIRWRNFDFGNPVRWLLHEGGQPGLAGGGFSEFQTAVAAWNGDPGSNVDLRNAGTTSVTTDFDTADDRNVVLFDDPNNDIGTPFSCASGGTIATTQVRFDGGPPHAHNDTAFLALREADMVTNKGLQCWIPTNNRAAEVFAHELGHGLGIDHSCGDDDNGPCDTALKREALMRAQAHGDGRGASLRQDDRDAIAFLYGVPGPTPPASPTGLTATALGSDLVRLAWNDQSSDEDDFEIERRTGSGSFRRHAIVGANREQYDDTSVTPGVAHVYRVRARNAGGASDYSNTASATPAGGAAPTALTAQAISASQILLAWQDNASGEGGYQVEGTAGGPFGLLATLPANSETATLSNLTSGTTYRFRVRAVGGSGASGYSNEAVATTFCVAGPNTLCLAGGRFKVGVDWRDFDDDTGAGSVVPFGSDDSGLLWFFASDNWEMLIKVLDGCAFNDRFWVFAAATTNVEYTLTVTDTRASVTRTYANPLGTSSAAITDTGAFATCSAAAVTTTPVAETLRAAADFFAASESVLGGPPEGVRAAGKGAGCTAGTHALCLNGGRFRVEVGWRDFVGGTGPASVVPFGSDDSGLLWFFHPDNWEMLIKVLDGCAFNGHFWVFSAATTNVGYTLTVTDTETGEVARYLNPLGTAAAATTDVEAFATCP